jgi:hypothetical protein
MKANEADFYAQKLKWKDCIPWCHRLFFGYAAMLSGYILYNKS